jgi:hypothetical protein
MPPFGGGLGKHGFATANGGYFVAFWAGTGSGSAAV